MGLVLPGAATPNATFEVPLEMLAACHLRVAQQCDTLRRLVPHLLAHGSDAQAQTAAIAVMRYFDTAAPHHHADEEQDLFPALLEAMAGSDAVCLRGLIQELIKDHRELEGLWPSMRGALAQVAAGHATQLDDHAVEAWISVYERHIAREEAELLPMAARLLSDAALDQVGRAMRERRGVGSA